MTTTVALDHVGLLTVGDGLAFYLTACCKATAKGSANSPTGVCCRACCTPIEPALAAAWDAADEAAWEAWERAFIADAHAKHPANITSGVPEQMVTAVYRQVAAAREV